MQGNTYSISEIREEITRLPERFAEDPEAVTVTRHGKPVMAILPWALYESIIHATHHQDNKRAIFPSPFFSCLNILREKEGFFTHPLSAFEEALPAPLFWLTVHKYNLVTRVESVKRLR